VRAVSSLFFDWFSRGGFGHRCTPFPSFSAFPSGFARRSLTEPFLTRGGSSKTFVRWRQSVLRLRSKPLCFPDFSLLHVSSAPRRSSGRTHLSSYLVVCFFLSSMTRKRTTQSRSFRLSRLLISLLLSVLSFPVFGVRDLASKLLLFFPWEVFPHSGLMPALAASQTFG